MKITRNKEPRREQFPVRWSASELSTLKTNAARHAMKPSEYLRWLVSKDTRAGAKP